jgi:hypothetical protein
LRRRLNFNSSWINRWCQSRTLYKRMSNPRLEPPTTDNLGEKWGVKVWNLWNKQLVPIIRNRWRVKTEIICSLEQPAKFRWVPISTYPLSKHRHWALQGQTQKRPIPLGTAPKLVEAGSDLIPHRMLTKKMMAMSPN